MAEHQRISKIMAKVSTAEGKSLMMGELVEQLPGGAGAADAGRAMYATALPGDEKNGPQRECPAFPRAGAALGIAAAEHLSPGAAIEAGSIAAALARASKAEKRSFALGVAGVLQPKDICFGNGLSAKEGIDACAASFWRATDAKKATATAVFVFLCKNVSRPTPGRAPPPAPFPMTSSVRRCPSRTWR